MLLAGNLGSFVSNADEFEFPLFVLGFILVPVGAVVVKLGDLV